MTRIQRNALLGILFPTLLTLCNTAAIAQCEPPAFKDPSETVAGWYHRHEIEGWIAHGGDRDVIRGILERIEAGEGERRDPELVDTIIAYGPGSWVWEWVQAGEKALAAGDRARQSQPHQALAHYRAALTYFTTASWPHLGRDDDIHALSRSREAYSKAADFFAGSFAHLEFPVGDKQTRGYLHLPEGTGPFPVVISSHGSDVTKEASLDFFGGELQARGIAMFAVDLPGIGEARDVSLLDGSDAVMVAAVDFLRTLDNIDPNRIVIKGSSFGGNAAARAFLNPESKATAVISICGPLHTPFTYPAEVLDSLPQLTIDGVKSRVGILGKPTTELAAVAPRLSLVNQGLLRRDHPITTPLLVITTNADPVAPLDDLAPLERIASNYEKVVFDQIGHCPPRWAAEAIIGRWLTELFASVDANGH